MKIKSTDIIINPSIKNVYGFLILSSFSVLIGTVSKNKEEINFEQKINNKDLRPIIKRRKGYRAHLLDFVDASLRSKRE